MQFRRVQEWFADHFGWAQYPKQQFIPRQQPLGYQLLPEQRLLLGFVGGVGALLALLMIGAALFLVAVYLFVPVPT